MNIPIQLQSDEHEIVMLKAEIVRLRGILIGTRYVLQQLREDGSDSMKRGFDMWLAKIDEGLNGNKS